MAWGTRKNSNDQQMREAGQKSLLIVGNPLPFHVGHHFFSAAEKLGIKVSLYDTRTAGSKSRIIQALYWKLADHRPANLYNFNQNLIARCQQEQPGWVLAIGIAPIKEKTLQTLHRLGITCVNFLTDDPWNQAHYARWFLKTLPLYHHLFTPRQANLVELKVSGCKSVHYLPFAYNPEVHYPEVPTQEAKAKLAADIVFTGGADSDRLPWISALIESDLRLALYGNYWERYPSMQPYARGHADLATLRQVVNASAVNLCLVRRANRDGHVMRTFEVPAMGGCMLTEHTDEHQRILGPEGEAVTYFHSIPEMLEKAKWLLQNATERQRITYTACQRITQNHHTYQDRLTTILQLIDL
ncbi:MAG: glycosyltransferase [Caldilineaceae bacterium]